MKHFLYVIFYSSTKVVIFFSSRYSSRVIHLSAQSRKPNSNMVNLMAKTSLHRCDPNGTLLFVGRAPAGCNGSLAIVTNTDAPLKKI
jgi:hypothetical protein